MPIFNFVVRMQSRGRGYIVKGNSEFYSIINGNREIRLGVQQQIYLKDTIYNFDFYFEGVVPVTVGDRQIADYSTPRWHDVRGFDLFPVFFPAVAEPIVTTGQYIDFADLKAGDVVLDLGAYSGLTCVLFDQAIPSGGRVIAVEADQQNISACERNFALYGRFTGRKIDLVKAAIWKHDKGISFSSEGSMGSSATSIVGTGRGKMIEVASLTLAQLAERQNLDRVDFIKCDIEGAETEIFDCPEFFARYSPKIMIECHDVNGLTAPICEKTLGKFGYKCVLIEQKGYPLPLLACSPAS
ncbi:FkbM family methyltransferase [Roseixanthobacter liquoris]|uniref:FkbM family methyltransferase n=1 Tax=Roseixanthobacter liquoris TaxID=3119921 RepID=UPI00372796FF